MEWLGIVSFNKGLKGYPTTASGIDKVRKAIEFILMTGKGERVMRPEFGSGVWKYVFEPEVIVSLIQSEVYEALRLYEPRIEIEKIDVNDFDGKIVVDIFYYYLGEEISQRIFFEKTK